MGIAFKGGGSINQLNETMNICDDSLAFRLQAQ